MSRPLPHFSAPPRQGRFVDVLAQEWITPPFVAATEPSIATWIAAARLTYDVMIDPAPSTDAGAPKRSIRLRL